MRHKPIIKLILILFLLFAFTGASDCGSEDTDQTLNNDDPDDDDDSDDTGPLDPSDDDDDDDDDDTNLPEGEVNISNDDQMDSNLFDELLCDHVSDYSALLEYAAQNGQTGEKWELDDLYDYLFHQIDGGLIQVLTDPYDGALLQQKIRQVTGVKWLLDETINRDIDVFVGQSEGRVDDEDNPYVRTQILFVDERLGSIPAVSYTLPDKAEPSPKIVALPGHALTPDGFFDSQRAWHYLQAGYEMIVINSRGMCGLPAEDYIAKEALQTGLPYLGMQYAEARIVERYFSYIGAEDVFFLGHSGGATVGIVFAHTDGEPFTGFVSDIQDEFDAHYCSKCGSKFYMDWPAYLQSRGMKEECPDHWHIMASTLPTLYEYTSWIYHYTSPLPDHIYEAPYEKTDVEVQKILAFFEGLRQQ